MNLTHLFDPSLIGRRDTWRSNSLEPNSLSVKSTRAAIEWPTCSPAAGSKGDRLCVYLANSIEMIDLYLACVKTGVIFVPINILYRDREMSHILSDAEPKLLVTAAEIPDLFGGSCAAIRRQASRNSDRRRRYCRAGLHLRDHGRVEGRDVDPQ